MTDDTKTRREQLAIALRIGVGVATLTTATIHYSLGGFLFVLNAFGYLAFAIAYLAPLGLFERYRFLIRLGLIGYTVVTIVGWMVTGPYFALAYLTKGVEVLLIAMLAADLYVVDGGPQGVLRQARDRFASIRARGFAGI